MIDESNFPNSNLDEPKNSLFEAKTKKIKLGPESLNSPYVMSSELEKCQNLNISESTNEFEMNFSMPATKLKTLVASTHKLKMLPQQLNFSTSFPLQTDLNKDSLKHSDLEEQNMIAGTQNYIQQSNFSTSYWDGPNNDVFDIKTTSAVQGSSLKMHSIDLKECLGLNVASPENKFGMNFLIPSLKLITFVTDLSKLKMLPDKIDFSSSYQPDPDIKSFEQLTLDKHNTVNEKQKYMQEHTYKPKDALFDIESNNQVQEPYTGSAKELKMDFLMPNTQLDTFVTAFHKLKMLPEELELDTSFSFLTDPNEYALEQLTLDEKSTVNSQQNNIQESKNEPNQVMFNIETQNQVLQPVSSEKEFEMNFSMPSFKLDTLSVPLSITSFPVQSDSAENPLEQVALEQQKTNSFKQRDNVLYIEQDVDQFNDQDIVNAVHISPQSSPVMPTSSILSGLIRNGSLRRQKIRTFIADPSPKNFNLIAQYEIKRNPRNLNPARFDSTAFPSTWALTCNECNTIVNSVYERSIDNESQSETPLFLNLTMAINSCAKKIIARLNLNSQKDKVRAYIIKNTSSKTEDGEPSKLSTKNKSDAIKKIKYSYR